MVEMLEYLLYEVSPSRALLALQAKLKGALGWASLPLPDRLLNDWTNPQRAFEYIQPCTDEIIFIPTEQLMQATSPSKPSPVRSKKSSQAQKPVPKSSRPTAPWG